MIDTAFAHRLGAAAGLEPEGVNELSRTIDVIREALDEHERTDFGVELMDCVRNGGGDHLEEVVHAWFFTAQIRSHPDYAWQKKEYENLQSSGELMASVEAAQLSA